MQRLRFLVWKEFLELRQNPRLFGVVIVAPIIQLTMLGYAATTDVRTCRWWSPTATAHRRSRDLIARFDASPQLHGHRHRRRRCREVDPYLERGGAWLALAIPPGYGADARSRAGRSRVQVVADGTDSNSTTVALGYATSLVGGYAQELVGRRGCRRRRAARRSTRASASGSTRSSRAASS